MTTPLPVEQIRSQFESELQRQHLVIESPTGSGKSTQLPIWCSAFGRVLVVEPRRIACRALGRFVAQSMSTECGQTVGYATRFQNKYHEQTQIVFVTPGIALSWFAQNRLNTFQFIILDEFHERRWDTDLLAALLKQQDQHRLIITSATVEGERLARYLGGQRLEAEGRSFPVSKSYRSQTDSAPPSLRDLAQRTLDATKTALAQQEKGDLLVFLPGKGEINACQQLLTGQVDAEVLPLHADIDSQQQDKTLRPGHSRRVILATNVAETSLTIPGIRVVIDSGLERRTHHRNGRTVLGLHPISSASADQRAGRAGRLGPGTCIRLWGAKAPLETFTPPQVLREELTDLLMAAASAGIPAQKLTFPDALPKHAVERAEQRLLNMGALNSEGLLTSHGQHIAPLPLDPIFAHLITAMPDSDTRSAMVDLAASITVGRSPLVPPQTEQQVKALAQWVPEACDMTTRIQLIRQQPPDELLVRSDRLKEARKIAANIRATLGLPQIHVTTTIPRQVLIQTTLKAAPELAFVRRMKRTHALGNGNEEVEVGKESRFLDKAMAAIVFDQHSLPGQGRKQTLNFATCMAPFNPKELIQAGLCETSCGMAHWQDGQITIEVQLSYAGRAIQHSETIPEGDPAIRAASQLILRGKIKRKIGPQIINDIEAWNLYRHLKKTLEADVKPEEWLFNRLKSLGMTCPEDLALIENEDLRVDGIPDWERAEFDEKYPRRIQLEKMTTDIHYDTQKKSITVERNRGSRRTAPRRIELPSWQGWRIYFKDASRVILIK